MLVVFINIYVPLHTVLSGINSMLWSDVIWRYRRILKPLRETHGKIVRWNIIQNTIIRLFIWKCCLPLHWRHNDHDGVWNHLPHDCLLKRLFRHRSKKTSKLRVTGLCGGNSAGPVISPHQGSVTRKMFPFDDVIMKISANLLGLYVLMRRISVPEPANQLVSAELTNLI